MSTLMGLAWIDLVPGADAGSALAVLRDRMSRLSELAPGSVLQAPGFVLQASATAVQLADGRHRPESMSGGNYGQLADAVVELAEGTGLVSHAFIALDHDEYGAEHIALDAHDDTMKRIYHYFAYPRDDEK